MKDKPAKALICTIGDEILIGQIVNTNSQWLGENFTLIGMEVGRNQSISDSSAEIKSVLDESIGEYQVILFTGGLGPTKDDITKKTLCEYFDDKLIQDQESLDNVIRIFTKNNREILEVNRMQALVPSKATVIQNDRGTAPGMVFEKNGSLIFSLPGVPYEMKSMMDRKGFEMIREKFSLGAIFHKTIKTSGIGESFLAEKIKDWENGLPKNIKLAYLPSPGEVKLRLTAKGESREELRDQVEKEIKGFSELAGQYIYGYEKTSLSKALGERLRARGETLSTAESCTGGFLAHLITAEAGSSDYFLGSVVSYSNQVKEDLLGVESHSLKEFGAVSEQVVEQMALGACRKFNSTFSIATSGIAGPGGGSKEKPVGTIWIAVSNGTETKSKLLNLSKSRDLNIKLTSTLALNLLLNWMPKS